jgi:serine/threonine protein kinase/predicted ATPase
MTPERWQQIDKLLEQALQQEPGRRNLFLDRACAEDKELRSEVETLLKAHDQGGSLLSSPALAATTQKPADSLQSLMGQSLSHYQILSCLGEGGMGVVYKARDQHLDRAVAIKVLPPGLVADPDRRKRFEREARAASALNHPNIVTVHEIGKAEVGHFIVMELVDGCTLRALSMKRPSLELLTHWARQIAQAIAAAHAAGVIHRDIKPDNVMVRNDGYVKLLDFGLARLARTGVTLSDYETAADTTPGMIVGTVRYMSPEQSRGEALTSATDVFSLGIVLYEVATGHHPFQGNSPRAFLEAIVSQVPPPPLQLNPGIPAAFDALISQMLEKDATMRPTAVSVEAVLTELLAAKPVGFTSTPMALPVTRPTVGRERERAELRLGFAAVSSGRSMLLCVSGEPGIGKTTLVEDFLAELAVGDQPCRIAGGRCSERLAGAEAYLPWLEALDSLVHGPGSESVARAMKLLAPSWHRQIAPLEPAETTWVQPGSQERMKRELVSFLQEVTRLRPLVLFLDDVHWADASTIDLLGYLAGKFATMRLLIVTAHRPSDLALGDHPFLQIKPELQGRGVCHEIPLEFLSRAETEKYLALEFPEHRFSADLPNLIHAKTEGNPLFMVDLVRFLRGQGVIARGQAGWELAQALPEVERDLPESVRGMIARKIAQLSEDDRHLLAAASVQGYEFDSAVLAKVLAMDVGKVEDRLEALEHVYAFVRPVEETEFPDGTMTLQYRFVHVLYQNAFYASLRPTRKATLSTSVAQSLLECHRGQHGSVASKLALLFEVAHDFQRATEYDLLAAQNAARVFANQEAAMLASRGLELLKKLPDSFQRGQLELNLQITLGTALMVTRGHQAPDVERAYARARELGQQLGETQHLHTALWGLWYVNLVKAELQTARDVGEQLLTLAESLQDSTRLLLAHRVLGQTLFFLGEFAKARAHQEEGIALYDRQKHHALAFLYGQDPGVSCRLWAAHTLWALGYPDQSLQKSQEAFALARELSHPYSLAYVQSFVFWLNYFRQEDQATPEQAETLTALAREQGFVIYELHGTVWHAWALARHRPEEEEIARMRQSLTTLQELGATIWLPYFGALLAETYMRAGHPEEGLNVLADALVAVHRTGQQQYEAELYRLKGELLLSLGVENQADAAGCFRQAIDTAQRQNAKSLELRAAISLSRQWQQEGQRAEARQMLGDVYGWFTEGFNSSDLRQAQALLEELT